jgi:hypothetical protein
MNPKRRSELIFIPFLLLYILIVLIFSSTDLVGDESRYLTIADNFIHLNFSYEFEVNIWNGPGYHLFIAPFVTVGLPTIFIKLLNAVLLYLSLILIFKTLKKYIPEKKALLTVVILGCYFPFYSYLSLIISECLSWFLISLVVFYTAKYFRSNSLLNRHLFFTSISLLLLCMTKVLFGYALSSVLVLALLFKIFRSSNVTINKSILVGAISLIGCVPWLLYTYSLTGNTFYWSSAGGKSLYAMSSPYEEDLGDWRSTTDLRKDPNHKAFIEDIWSLSQVQRDSAYMKTGIENLKKHPSKYLQNWTANVGRLFFSYPFSKSKQSIKTYFRLLPNIIVVSLILISFFILFKKSVIQELPTFLIPLLIFFSIYLFLSSLLSAYNRFFMITMPYWVVFVSLIFNQSLLVRFRRYDN